MCVNLTGPRLVLCCSIEHALPVQVLAFLFLLKFQTLAETNSLRPAQRGRIEAYPNSSEAEEEERLGGARVDVGEELEALEVIGKLVKGHDPPQAPALPSSGNEEVSDYEPNQSDDASEEDDIDEYDD